MARHPRNWRWTMLVAVLAGAGAWTGAMAAPPAVDPAGIAALGRVGAALRAQGHFFVTSDASIEIVLDSGQKIETGQAIRYRVQQPGRLRVDLENDGYQRQVFFGDRKLTVWAPRKQYYATVDVEADTLRQLVGNAATKYDLELPLSDLFLWGTDAAPSSAITSALRVGDETIGNDTVEHWALRQPGVDWQVWISKESSLPRKLVITSLGDPALPEFSATLEWDTKTPIADSVFAFQPPAGASRIVMAPAVAAATEGQ